MILSAFLAAALAAQQPSPPLGQRDGTPQRLLGELGLAPDAGEDPVIAAAQAYPLGSAQNPIRVGGPEGERTYLARLRCGDGSAPGVGPRTDGGVGAFGSVVAAYTLDCGAAAPGRAALTLDMYHDEHREERAPPGFTIVAR